MLLLDTETVGFTGPPITIQTGEPDSDLVDIHSVWRQPVKETLDLIEAIVNEPEGLVIFNASYESFHFNKWYNIFRRVKDSSQPPKQDEILALEQTINFSDLVCLKPHRIIDIYLLLKKYYFQYTMVHKPIVIRKIPLDSAVIIKKYLERFCKESIPDIMFYRCKNRYERWSIKTYQTDKGSFADLTLNFEPSLALKVISQFVFGIKPKRINIPKEFMPNDSHEYLPFNGNWINVLQYHIAYWETNKEAVEYATEDIHLLHRWIDWIKETKELDDLICGDAVDTDSELAWMVGAVRFKGFPVDKTKLEKMIVEISRSSDNVPTDFYRAVPWLKQACNPLQASLVTDSSKKTLEAIIRAIPDSEVGKRAQRILKQRELDKQHELLIKLHKAGRFHPDFNVIGTQSNRMSGRGGLNAQGINHDQEVREIFTFADPGNVLSGGDFVSQEITIADAVWNDEALRADLQAGIKLHRTMCSFLYDIPVDKVDETTEQYKRAKNSVFGLIYGAMEPKLAETANVSIERAQQAYTGLTSKYRQMGLERLRIAQDFCSMKQPNGIGSQVVWDDPKEFITSLFGFRRYFTIENAVCKFIFNLANNIPPELKTFKERIVRRDRPQTIAGATQSALFAAAFQLQAKNMRAANNHRIQSSGAGVTKFVQYAIWQIQPAGINSWSVQPFNVHDEILTVNNCPDLVAETVERRIMELREWIPLLKIKWNRSMDSWAAK